MGGNNENCRVASPENEPINHNIFNDFLVEMELSTFQRDSLIGLLEIFFPLFTVMNLTCK